MVNSLDVKRNPKRVCRQRLTTTEQLYYKAAVPAYNDTDE